MKTILIFVATCLAFAAAGPQGKAAMGFHITQAVNADGSTQALSWSTNPATFYEAAIFCINRGEELLVIKDAIKQKEIQTLMASNGFVQERWLWIQYRDTGFFWGDGQQAVFTNFYQTNTDPEYWGTILGSGSNQFQWDMKNANSQLYFVCQTFE